MPQELSLLLPKRQLPWVQKECKTEQQEQHGWNAVARDGANIGNDDANDDQRGQCEEDKKPKQRLLQLAAPAVNDADDKKRENGCILQHVNKEKHRIGFGWPGAKEGMLQRGGGQLYNAPDAGIDFG